MLIWIYLLILLADMTVNDVGATYQIDYNHSEGYIFEFR